MKSNSVPTFSAKCSRQIEQGNHQITAKTVNEGGVREAVL